MKSCRGIHFGIPFALLRLSLFILSIYLFLFCRALFTSRYRENHGICVFVHKFNFIAWIFGKYVVNKTSNGIENENRKKFIKCGFLCRLTLRPNFYSSVVGTQIYCKTFTIQFCETRRKCKTSLLLQRTTLPKWPTTFDQCKSNRGWKREREK